MEFRNEKKNNANPFFGYIALKSSQAFSQPFFKFLKDLKTTKGMEGGGAGCNINLRNGLRKTDKFIFKS